MKKQTLFLLAGGMMAFASCSNQANNQNPSQAQIDSMVNVKTGQMQATMQAQNDSTINAIAKAKADSEIAAQKQTVQTVQVVHEERNDRGHYGEHRDRDHRDRDHNNNNQGYDQNNNGYNNPGNAKPVTDRPGATNVYNNNGNPVNPKPVTDRPGATNTTR